ncbi:MAG: hypothetical protein KC933_18750 [Myxococcales bacterium]|nr:hypothetical protein [Myxococcales bacterium]MCB9651888.1 hypothetical protein [Deltaproteobacteria bacterium]
MKYPTILSAAFSASLMLTHVACGGLTEVCTQIGCNDTTVITMDATSWPDGQYVFTAEINGIITACNLTLPRVEDATCSDDRLRLGLSTDGLPAVLVARPAPESLDVKVELDGTTVLDTTVMPERTFSYPNGKECGPECVQGEATVTLSL